MFVFQTINNRNHHTFDKDPLIWLLKSCDQYKDQAGFFIFKFRNKLVKVELKQLSIISNYFDNLLVVEVISDKTSHLSLYVYFSCVFLTIL